jgi:branched-chain amino acid transport system substrate-binding protein
LYALAATAVVLLTGKEPQQLIDPNSYRWNWQEEVPLSPKLAWVLTKMLSPNPSERFGSATEVRKTLRDISIVTPTPKRTEPAPTVGRPVNRQSPTSKIRIFPRLTSKLPFLATLTAVVLLGSFWGLKQGDLEIASRTISNSYNSVRAESQLRERFSQGEKVLISQTTTPEKELAAAAFAKGNYDEAVSLFSASLKTLANDPEALIYLNNARSGREKAYSIAVSVPIGSDVNAAQEILRGVAQAQNQVNQGGGMNGIPLKVQIINDDNEPEVAQQVATTLSQNPEILGVVGHYASDVTLATAKIYQSGQLVAISPISTSVKLSNLSPYLFRTVPSDYLAARALAEYMLHKLNQPNVAIFYSSQSNYSESLKSEFIAAVSLGGGRVVGEFDLSDANFSAADSLKQAKDGGAEVLMLAANTGTLDKALQVVQVNHQRLSLLAGDDVYTPKTLQVAGELAEGMVLAIPWHIRDNPDAEFAQVASQLWVGEVNWRTAMAYDAAQALIAAIERSPTRIGVQKTLSDPNFSTPGACDQIRFFPSGDRLKPIDLVKIQPSDRHSFSYEFTPIVSER